MLLRLIRESLRLGRPTLTFGVFCASRLAYRLQGVSYFGCSAKGTNFTQSSTIGLCGRLRSSAFRSQRCQVRASNGASQYRASIPYHRCPKQTRVGSHSWDQHSASSFVRLWAMNGWSQLVSNCCWSSCWTSLASLALKMDCLGLLKWPLEVHW